MDVGILCPAFIIFVYFLVLMFKNKLNYSYFTPKLNNNYLLKSSYMNKSNDKSCYRQKPVVLTSKILNQIKRKVANKTNPLR